MKPSEIKVGGHYKARVGNKLTTVRVDGIRTVPAYRSVFSLQKDRDVPCYDVTNVATGRTSVFRSAARFYEEVKDDSLNKQD